MINALKRFTAGVASVAIIYYAVQMLHRILFNGSTNTIADPISAVLLFIIGWPFLIMIAMAFFLAGMFALSLAKYAVTGKWDEEKSEEPQ